MARSSYTHILWVSLCTNRRSSQVDRPECDLHHAARVPPGMATTENPLTRFTGILAAVGGLDTLRERLCEASRVMLDADGVLLTSETVPDGRTVVCWTQLLSRRLEALQSSLGEGPMIDALARGTVVRGEFGELADERWPLLRRSVADLDFTGSLIAIPLRSDLPLSGALLVHRSSGSRDTDHADARFLGSAIGTAVLQDPGLGAQGHVFAEILADRDLVHRATDILQVEASVHYEDALALLRGLAFVRGQDLGSVAKEIVEGHVGLGQDD